MSAEATAVTTGEQLLNAAGAGARDIEILGHLDLRGLKWHVRPSSSNFNEPQGGVKELLYSTGHLRSLRGNCSSPDVATPLGLTVEEQATLLPLKPRQCVVIVPGTILTVEGGQVWLDNLYLMLHSTVSEPFSAFVRTGNELLPGSGTGTEAAAPDLFVTNLTLHAHGRGGAFGFVTNVPASRIFLQDSIFTDWGGGASPLMILHGSIANVVDTVFRSMRLNVELADVSFGGMVRFKDVKLANVSLNHNKIVSTSSDAYEYYGDDEWQETAVDEKEYDVEFAPVPVAERSMFGEEFQIADETMSDCLYVNAADGAVLPGCPLVSAQRRQEIARQGGVQRRTYISQIQYESTQLYLLTEGRLRLLREQVGLKPLPPPPAGWPPFSVTPPADPVMRTSLTLQLPMPPGTAVPALVWTPEAAAAARGPVHTPGQRLRGDEASNATLVLIVTFALVAVTAAAAAMWSAWSLRRCSHKGQRSFDEGTKRPWPRRLQYSTVPAASEVPPFLSDWGSLPGSTVNDTSSSLHHSSLIPRCAMNPAYEYALPTQVARLMAGPCVKTEHVGANRFDAASPIHSQPGGCRGRIPWLQSPMLAATQPLNAASLRSGAMPIGGSCSSSGRYNSFSRTNSAPVYSLHHSGNPQESLGAHSNAVGSTIVMSPYMPNGRSACMLTRCTHDQSAIGSTIVSTRSWDDAETPPPPPPQQQDVFGINMGGLRDTVGTRDSARIHEPVRAQNRQWWQRMWLPAAVQTPPDDSTVNSVQSAQQLLARLQRQLDGFRTDDLFLMRFEMLGAQKRRRGGQAVVQFAEDVEDMSEYAIKFFLDYESFLTEAALYAACFPHIHSQVSDEVKARADATVCLGMDGAMAVHMADVAARFLPQVEAVCDGSAGELVDPQGRPLPPCIVLEKGESLHDWSDRAQPDLFTSLAVLSNISKRLADMHDAGYVHRDLKPGNVMWLPRANRWTIIDFGCVAGAGEAAPIRFTLAYAAPEVVRAFLLRRHYIDSTPALDTWSLGVMAFELLTGAPAFDHISDGSSRIIQRLRGDLPLPWEGDLSLEVRRRLGSFHGLVLQLLHRDPAKRITMRSFHRACNRLFAARTTVEA